MIALTSFFIGAAVLFSVVSDPLAALASSVLAVFGWFYLPLAFVVTGALWRVYSFVSTSMIRRITFITASTVVGAALMSVIGVPQQGAAARWTVGCISGGGAGALAAALMVFSWRKHEV